MNNPTFRTVLRGYEPAQVDAELSALTKALAGARAELGTLSVQLNEARQGQAVLEQRVASAEARVAEAVRVSETVSVPTYAGLGERIGKILTLADQEAEHLRRSAKEEAQALHAQATEQAYLAAAKADRYAVETRTSAEADAEAMLANAQRHADEMIDHADREGAARREEGEAVFEAQQARAARAAADFERTLAERRDRAAADFEEQMGQRTERLRVAEENLQAAENEALRIVADAQSQAEAIRAKAQHESEELVTEARTKAERIRRDSERELAAATQRRDSITAQLSNVRQMLATLGGGAAGMATDVVQPAEPAPEESASQDDQAAPPAEPEAGVEEG